MPNKALAVRDAAARLIDSLRQFLRVTGIAAMIVWCGAMQCLPSTPNIQYAQGYGYVIKVICTYCKDSNHEEFYFTFDTYQDADDWLHAYNYLQGRGIPSGYLRAYGSQDTGGDGVSDFQKITKLLGPVPIPDGSGSIDLNQPQPAIPQ
jgi:hypothetical protein